MNDRHNGIESIVKAGIFDETWYATQYPDVRASGLAPVEHYLKYGVRLRRKPNPSPGSENHDFYKSGGAPTEVEPDKAQELRWPIVNKLPATDIQEGRLGTEGKGGSKTADVGLQRMEHERFADKFSVEQLKLKLWGGFSRYAIDCLEEIKNDFRRDSTERSEAAYCLMQWFYVVENYSRAYENVLIYGMLCNAFLDKQFVIASTLCLIKLERLQEANDLIDTALNDRSKSAIYLSDYLFLKAGIVRLLDPGEQGEKEQLDLMANAFKSMGLAPVEKFFQRARFYFGNLTAIASAKTAVQLEKVSILIPAFNAASSISYVIRSLQAQTWRNLEIIVVDDCSTDNTCDVVSEIMPFDNRIKLVRKTVNEGAYPARNSGLEHATGDLIMVHDSDDWSHPQKIEIQIRALNNAAGAVAAMSNWIRVDDQFMPTVHSRPRHTIKSLSFPSLLFKKEVVDQVGPWQPVRVSGDAEFKTRIERHYGANAIVKLAKVLSISLSRNDSLTQKSATHINTLHFGVRWQYLGLYDYFHARKLKNDLNCGQCIAVSKAVIGNRSKSNEAESTFDFIFVSDFVSDTSIIDYVAATCRTGAKVGIYHWRNFEEDFAAPLSRKLYEACIQHRIGLLTCSDAANARCVIFGDLKILQYRQDRFPSIKAPVVVGLVKSPYAVSPAPLFSQQELIHIRATIKVLFGCRVRFAPSCALFHYRLQEMELEKDSLAEPLTPAIDADTWCIRQIGRRAQEDSLIEVGYSDNGLSPDVSEILGIEAAAERITDLPIDPERFAGRDYQAEMIYRRIPKSDLATEAMVEAMRNLDFYLCFPEAGPYDAFNCGILEAMALGIPVVLPQEMKSIFGPAAIYAHAGEAEDVMRAVWRDEPRYLKFAMSGRDFVRGHFNLEKFAARLARLLSPHETQSEPYADYGDRVSQCNTN